MKKSIYSMLLTALLGLTGMNAWALDQVDGVYQIATAADLVEFASIVNGGATTANAVLTADIDCSSITSWTPIGSATDSDNGKYKGTFDGQGHTISNLVISRTIGCTGIFNTTAGVTLKNFIVDSSCSITDTGANLAGIVGRHQASGTSATATSTFSGIGNAGDVTISGSGKENPGGLIGGCWGKKDVSIIIENCWTSGTILSSGGKSGNCGAFIGWFNGGKLTVNNSWSIATVETAAADKYLVRAASNSSTAATFNNCYSLNGTQVTNLDADDVASGALCFKLNEALSADVWFQNLDNGDDVDEVPVPFSTHGKVYKFGSYNCGMEPATDVISYTNTPTIEPHVYALDGFCSVCGNLKQDSEGYFEISEAAHLAWFANHANNTNQAANAKLTADIDMTSIAATWVPIGDWHTGKVTSAFSGHFDGQGHRITGFNVTTSQNYYGIFGVVSAATIENFSIEGTITNDSYTNIGAIGYSRDTEVNIQNIQSYLTITNNATDKNAGGILGSGNNGTTNIDRCAFFGTINANGKTNAGGIVGYFNNNNAAIVNITNCLFDGTISSEISNSYCGGMAGYGGANVSSVTITNCLSLGTLEAPVNGQFFGNIRNAGSTIINCYYQGDNTIGNGSTALTNLEATAVTDKQLASGEICYLLNGDQTEISWYQTVGTNAEPTLDATNAQVYVNGTVCPDTGAPQGTVSYSNSEGTTIGSHVPVDGFCTYCGTFDETYMSANSEGNFEIGTPAKLKWFAVYANQVEPASNALLTADIDLTGITIQSIGNADAAYTGIFDGQEKAITGFSATGSDKSGFFGNVNGATIKNFSIAGTLTVTSGTGSGVVGWAENSTISNIHSALTINVPNTGVHHVGGVVGSAHSNNIIDRCSFSGSMTVQGSTDNFAGVVAYITHTTTTHDEVTNCVNYGDITFSNVGCAAGGILGYLNSTFAVVKNCLNIGSVHYNGEGNPTNGGAILGKTKGYSEDKVTNNYWKEGSGHGAAINNSGNITLTTAQEVTTSQLASGEITAKLGIAFRQNIGSDEAPVLDLTHNVVAEITEAGYATLYVPDTDVTIPDGVEAYTGVILNEGWLHLNDVTEKIAAEEAVVLAGEAGIYSFVPTSGATKDVDNVLKGSAEDIAADGKYVLAKPNDEPAGFYLANAGTIKAGKAYLELPEESDVKGFIFKFDDETTGINEVNGQWSMVNGQSIFNLAGQMVNGKLPKGIYIVGGKKRLF